jgi:UDP-N-acetylglucosamine:LPS N-acetylglucosamine transferase
VGRVKPRILILSGSGGHHSLAEALNQFFLEKKADGWKTRLVGPKSLGFKGLDDFLRYFFPSLIQLPYQVSKKDKIRQIHRRIYRQTSRTHLKMVNDEIVKFRPNIVLTSHFLFHYGIEKALSSMGGFKFFNFVSDPVTVHPIAFNDRATNLVYDKRVIKLGQKYGLDREQLFPVGWAVREQFYQSWPKNKTRKRLGFQPEVFTILICGGTGGANSALKIIPALLKSKKPLQIIIVAGNNRLLYNFGKSFKRVFSASFSVWQSRIKIRTFRFVKNFAPLIQVADLVVGKAGPNLIFDSVVCRKPFLAVTHVHGHEDGNLTLIKEKKLGWVQEDAEKAAQLLLKIIYRPRHINRLRKHLLKEKKHLALTKKKVLSLVKKSLSAEGGI